MLKLSTQVTWILKFLAILQLINTSTWHNLKEVPLTKENGLWHHFFFFFSAKNIHVSRKLSCAMHRHTLQRSTTFISQIDKVGVWKLASDCREKVFITQVFSQALRISHTTVIIFFAIIHRKYSFFYDCSERTLFSYVITFFLQNVFL